ncbi:uncharacterized protein LOC132749436 [Ruditapes philippinarum]|uniref:uncharacterized protein LOC132749436 n=1 Tax=Ruditapes philippinarum TaxID=129788 RepID=UPI00295A9FEB|nr:uncharacterized protein LOC132749436 [Ruditapes philippinarum]
MPEHTPSKQSKIDLSETAGSLSHQVSVSSYTLDSNEENYSAYLERYCHASQLPDSGFESACSVSSATTPTSTYQSSKNEFTMDSQWQESSACSLQKSVISNTSCSDMVSQTDGMCDKRLTDFQPFQNICSSSKNNGTWNVSPASVNTFWSSKQGRNPDQQSDPSYDTGYSSHSTGSSYLGQGSQLESSFMDQGSQLDLEAEDNGSLTGNKPAKDNYLCGENELEDLLYHFQNFFQNRFESEFQRYREAVYGIIQEQQSHVRQIVHTAIREQSSSQRSFTEEFLSEETEKEPTPMRPMNQTGTGMPFNSLLDKDFFIPISTCLQPSNSTSVVKDGTTRNKLLDLYSLSCSVSTLLAKKQFKS